MSAVDSCDGHRRSWDITYLAPETLGPPSARNAGTPLRKALRRFAIRIGLTR